MVVEEFYNSCPSTSTHPVTSSTICSVIGPARQSADRVSEGKIVIYFRIVALTESCPKKGIIFAKRLKEAEILVFLSR